MKNGWRTTTGKNLVSIISDSIFNLSYFKNKFHASDLIILVVNVTFFCENVAFFCFEKYVID